MPIPIRYSLVDFELRPLNARIIPDRIFFNKRASLGALVVHDFQKPVVVLRQVVFVGFELFDRVHVIHVLHELLGRERHPFWVRFARKTKAKHVQTPRPEPPKNAAQPGGPGHEVLLRLFRAQVVLGQVFGSVVAQERRTVVAQVPKPREKCTGIY